jgi:Fe-S oxidoreductase
MRGAADRCQNIGLCRTTDAGVMCPSYRATRREEDSTRGRANALVKALSDPDPRTALGDERLHEVLDLRLMCKACKSECPLSVDMATLKSEALHQKHQTKGVPLRSRVFAGIRELNRLGSATAPLSNLPGRVPALRRLLGTAGARPEFRKATFRNSQGLNVAFLNLGHGGRSPSSPTRSPASPSPPSGSPPSNCSNAPGGTCGWSRVGAAGGRRSPRGCSTRPPARHPGSWTPWPGRRARSRASSRRAC